MWRSFLNKWLSQRPVPPNRGAQGEQLAERFLVRERNMRFVARNWRNPRDRREEIDLVMRDGDILVFVEVKTRSAKALVPGFYAVNDKKRKILRRGINAYLRRLKTPPLTHRCDVVEVSWPTGDSGTEPGVRHFTNVALPRRK